VIAWAPAFIARRWLDNYKLFISIYTKGFTRPVGPVLRRSVCRGRSDASTMFEPVLESSGLPLTIHQDLHDSGGTVPRSVPGEVA
jgi:hypothetical protein